MTILTFPAAAAAPAGSLRQRFVDDMTLHQFSREMQRNYICDVVHLATFLRRLTDTAMRPLLHPQGPKGRAT